MFLQKTAVTCIVLGLFYFAVSAQQDGLLKIDEDDLKKHLEFIASDDLQGRRLGTEVDGLEITAKYLAQFAEKVGLKPGAPNYFQDVPIVKMTPAGIHHIEIHNSKGKAIFQTEALVQLSFNASPQACKEGSFIFAGFGDVLPETNLEGKILIVAQGSAELLEQNKALKWNKRMEKSKIERLLEKKPKGIIIITSPYDKNDNTFKEVQTRFSRESYSLKDNDEIPVLLTTPSFADALLGRKGSFAKYLSSYKKNAVLVSADEKTISFQVGEENEVISGKNVIGVVEGSDPELKNEYVIFLAHYDHLGVSKNGDVYNGADDNGSGTVAIMEVAEAFASLEKKPKRSIVFLWVTCEELGHFGSKYYCDDPIFPLEKTVAAINLDMVGRVYESPRDDIYKDSPKKVKDFDGLYTLANDVWPLLADINNEKCKELGLVPDTSLPKDRFLRASDHYSFHNKGVPVLNYATGYHADYHKVGDEVSKINYQKIKRVAQLCFLLGYEVADHDDTLF